MDLAQGSGAVGEDTQSPRSGVSLQPAGDQRLTERGRQLPAHAGGGFTLKVIDNELHHSVSRHWQSQWLAEAASPYLAKLDDQTPAS